MTSRRRVVIRHMTSLLTGKTAVIYGGGGNIGGAAARAFAREGAQVHLVGRTRESLDRVAADTGAEVAVLDATDQAAVDAHADRVGRIDISFNLITREDAQGTRAGGHGGRQLPARADARRPHRVHHLARRSPPHGRASA